jgi:hypothetical protein
VMSVEECRLFSLKVHMFRLLLYNYSTALPCMHVPPLVGILPWLLLFLHDHSLFNHLSAISPVRKQLLTFIRCLGPVMVMVRVVHKIVPI